MNKAFVTEDGTFLWHCPGCEGGHAVPIVGGRAWNWNQSLTSPTLNPSVLVHTPRCHCFVRDGKIQFLADCGHKLAGHTVEMEDEPRHDQSNAVQSG